jgi:O-antigen/teichoic acid export membrane protein
MSNSSNKTGVIPFFQLVQQQGIKHFFRGMRGEFLVYSSSTAILQFSKLLTTLFIARLLSPVDIGWWNSLQPLIIYGAMLHFGVLNGMNRDVPYFVGKGEREKAKHIRQVSWGIALITAFIAAGLAFGGAFIFDTPPIVHDLLLWIAPLLIFQQWYLFHSMVLASNIRFGMLSVQQYVLGFIYPIFCFGMAKAWGLNGFLIAQSLTNLLVCVLIAWLTREDLRPHIDWHETKRLATVGFPIMTAGFLYDTLRTLDRWVILTFLGVEQVGFYTLAIIILQVVTLLPRVITVPFYPRMAQHFGENHSYAKLRTLVVRSFLAAAGLIWPFGLIIFWGIGPFTRYFLPDYATGIMAAMIVTVGVTISRPVAGTGANFLNAIGKANTYMRVQFLTVLIQLVLTIGAIQLNFGLVGVAWGVAITQVVNMFMLLGILLYLMNIKRQPSL